MTVYRLSSHSTRFYIVAEPGELHDLIRSVFRGPPQCKKSLSDSCTGLLDFDHTATSFLPVPHPHLSINLSLTQDIGMTVWVTPLSLTYLLTQLSVDVMTCQCHVCFALTVFAIQDPSRIHKVSVCATALNTLHSLKHSVYLSGHHTLQLLIAPGSGWGGMLYTKYLPSHCRHVTSNSLSLILATRCLALLPRSGSLRRVRSNPTLL